MTTQRLVDTGAPFLQETREVASFYVELYLDPVKEGLARSPAPGRSGRVATDSEYVAAGGPPAPTPNNAALIAQRLKYIGDRIDDKVKRELEEAFAEEMKSKTVYLIGREQFGRVCQNVLSACSQSLRNGWEQATVVYMGMGRMIRELRSQAEQEEVSQRETMMQNFAGETLQQLGLETWIDGHGGMRCFGDGVEPQNACVPIEGSSVDA